MAANEGTGDASGFRNGLPAEATLEDKKAFEVQCTRNYQAQNWKGDSLSEYFADDFNGYFIEEFVSIDSDTRRNLRNLLRHRGVYVPKASNIVIVQALYQIVQEEIPWTENDPDKQIVLTNTTPKRDQVQSSRQGRNIYQAPVREIDCNGEQPDGCTTETDTEEINPDNNRPHRGCNMENLFKVYSNAEDKYSGSTTDNFERKYMLFLERCDQVDIPDEDRHRAFSFMLIDSARQYYFDSLKAENLDLKYLESAVKNRFQTPERNRALLREWEVLTLNRIINSNTSKRASECLELLMKKLSDIQTSLKNEYRNETILRKKLLNAVRDVESCRLAHHKPADTIKAVISDLHASLATMKNSDNHNTEPSAHLFDRSYVKKGDDRNRGGPSRQKKCFVCKRSGCWSTNHSSKERIKAYCNSKVLRKSVTSVSPEEESDDYERETADTLDDMDRLGIYLNNLENVLVHSKSALKAPITRVNGHPFVQWNQLISWFLTTSELRRLHRRFGHPSTEKLINVLDKAGIDDIGPDTWRTLTDIEHTSAPCQTYAQKPRRFKFTLQEDKDFNHTIYADILYIDGKPILHVVDEATHFQPARWLGDMTAETV